MIPTQRGMRNTIEASDSNHSDLRNGNTSQPSYENSLGTFHTSSNSLDNDISLNPDVVNAGIYNGAPTYSGNGSSSVNLQGFQPSQPIPYRNTADFPSFTNPSSRNPSYSQPIDHGYPIQPCYSSNGQLESFDKYGYRDYNDSYSSGYSSNTLWNNGDSGSMGPNSSTYSFTRSGSLKSAYSDPTNPLYSDSSFSMENGYQTYSSSRSPSYNAIQSSFSHSQVLQPSHMPMKQSPRYYPQQGSVLKSASYEGEGMNVEKAHSSFKNVENIKPYIPSSNAGNAGMAGQKMDMDDSSPPVARKNRRKGGRITEPTSEMWTIDLDKLSTDKRTTLMIRNIPNGFQKEVLLKILNNYIPNQFDFFYLPLDFGTKYNLGYGYINVKDVETVRTLYTNFHNKHWPNTPSQKVCQVCYARIQGKEQMMLHSKDWAVMHLSEQYRPVFFEPVVQMVNGKKEEVMQRVTPDVDMRMR